MDDAGTAMGAAELAACAGDILERLRLAHPRVHCITNLAATSFTANMLLAAGARPSLTFSDDEIGDFVRASRALLVNLGTLDGQRRSAIALALDAAREARVPWVLDPVLIDVSRPRARLAAELIGQRPAAVRGNGAEVAALMAMRGKATVNAFAAELGSTLAVTGALDHVSDGVRSVRLANGHEWMGRVTAVGCVTSALLAAFLAVERDAFMAASACLAAVGVAGEMAAEKADGPGTFQPRFIDAVAALTEAELASRIVIA